MRRFGWVLALLMGSGALAQESASHKLEEHVLNAAGRPQAGVTAGSAGFRLTLDSVGDGMAPSAPASASFRIAGGFGAAYAPAGDVAGLRFLDAATLAWDAHPAAGSYALYRDLLSALPGLGYGACAQPGLGGTTTTDSDLPLSSDGYFYLVTVENRLAQEGTKGDDSGGVERPNPAPCP